jgi:hypothetical protein
MKNSFLPTIFISFILSLGVMGSCTEEPEKTQDYSAALLGKWELKKAFRDNKETTTLDNTTFEFTENGELTTNFNLNGELATNPYELAGNKINQKGAENTTYQIQKADSSNLTLTTSLLNINFRLVLEKKIPESKEE